MDITPDVQLVIDMAVNEYKKREGSAHAYRIPGNSLSAKVVREAFLLGQRNKNADNTVEKIVHELEDIVISALKEKGAEDDYLKVLREEFTASEKKYNLTG